MKMKPIRLGVLLFGAALHTMAQEPEWNPATIKECDRTCLIGMLAGSDV